jgi:L-fuconolactonase
MWIDSHQHFWLMRDRVGQWPPPELAKIHRDFLPADLEPTLRACGVKGTVLVQSLPTMADTDFMLGLADRHPFIVGVVGWVDLKAADAAVHIARLAAHPKLRSLRPMLQDIADVAWIDDPALDPAIEAMRDYGLRFDALVMPQHLKALTTFAKRHPDLPIVIDHGAKPRIATGYFSAWRTAMAALGLLPNVHCKLSGLLTEAGERREPAALRPYVETILEIFGAARVLWGSDWPVLELAGEYQAWLALCLDLVSVADHATVFGANACDFYGLPHPA